MQRILCFALLFVVIPASVCGQEKKRAWSIRDSTDHAIDLSDWIINAHGFFPVPALITEPAIGFGGAIAPILIEPHHRTAADLKHKNMAPIPPDITGGLLMYTASNTWGTGLFRSATITKWRLHYTVASGYFNVNMKYYRTVKEEEQTYKFNIRTVPVFLRLQKQIGYSNWTAGLQYIFAHTTAALKNDTPILDSIFGPKDFKSNTSVLGPIIEYDKRDNTFTPNKGSKIHLAGNYSGEFLGSDFDYWNLTGYVYKYIPVSDKWICGLRGDMEQIVGDAPFYVLPSIDLRGVPKARYQGKTNALLETEQRWNMFPRWSAVFFTGAGKAFNDYKDFGSSEWVYSYGTGFRYLIARKLKLYMGADIAKGPEQWGFYIQFGSAWLK